MTHSTTIAIALSLCCASSICGQPELRTIDPDDKTGTSRAVVVPDNVTLVHTGQMLPLDAQGKLVAKDRPAEQIAKVLDNVAAALRQARADFTTLVKVNVYVAQPAVVDEVKKAFARQFQGKVKPAVSFVIGALPHPDAGVAMDVVAVTPLEDLRFLPRMLSARDLLGTHGDAHLAVLPPWPKVYVAGQAEKGDLSQATRRTLESLRKTLKFLDLHDGHVIQLKAFLTPMEEVETVKKEIGTFFGRRVAPPVIFVEWKSSLPIEIELIAAAPPPKEKPADALEFLTPPGMTASPIYSRVTRINHGKTIYVSGLYGMNAEDAAGEIELIFTTLGDVLKKAGSDERHLAKATYYVSTDDASRKLNELRPKYYDPKRPPSASKAMVPGVGVAGRSVTLDMIAVTRP